MKLGIMQPYFFPYLGYFDLINYSTRWIVFDTVQYIRHSWINRNRILHPTSGWQYIIVPLKKYSRETPIKDIMISSDSVWRDRMLGQLQHYRKRAPFFLPVYELLHECLNIREQSISRFNAQILKRVCEYLGIHFEYEMFSEMELDIGPIHGPGDWALRISTTLGVKEYVNPPGGEQLFDKSKFEENSIILTIRHLPTFEYKCHGYDFVPNLSIIDVLMWNEPRSIMDFLRRYGTGYDALAYDHATSPKGHARP
jgi:hypothetical protein